MERLFDHKLFTSWLDLTEDIKHNFPGPRIIFSGSWAQNIKNCNSGPRRLFEGKKLMFKNKNFDLLKL